MKTRNPYRVTEEQAWNWYNKNIAYKPMITGTEMVLLKGKWKDTKAIKIPVDIDNRNNRLRLCEELGITIQKYLFNSRYSLFGEEIFYRVYSYK